MTRSNCKLCGQPLADEKAIRHVRAKGAHARTLTNAQRTKLRRLLLDRHKRINNTDVDRVPGWSMQKIAERVGCSRRTAIRELEWLEAEGKL